MDVPFQSSMLGVEVDCHPDRPERATDKERTFRDHFPLYVFGTPQAALGAALNQIERYRSHEDSTWASGAVNKVKLGWDEEEREYYVEVNYDPEFSP